MCFFTELVAKVILHMFGVIEEVTNTEKGFKLIYICNPKKW